MPKDSFKTVIQSLEVDTSLSSTATRVFKITELPETDLLKKARERFEEAAQAITRSTLISRP